MLPIALKMVDRRQTDCYYATEIGNSFRFVHSILGETYFEDMIRIDFGVLCFHVFVYLRFQTTSATYSNCSFTKSALFSWVNPDENRAIRTLYSVEIIASPLVVSVRQSPRCISPNWMLSRTLVLEVQRQWLCVRVRVRLGNFYTGWSAVSRHIRRRTKKKSGLV